MKTIKTKISIAMLVLAGLLISPSANAQVNVSVNISSQAIWGPVGYDYVEYYYMPEIDVFYYVPTAQFIYWNGDVQYFVSDLPTSFSVNLYSTYKVVVNKPKPYLNHGYYVSHYKKHKHSKNKQGNIRDSKNEKYYVVKGHPNHGKAKGGNNKSVEPKKSKGNSKTQSSQTKAPKSDGGQKSQQKSSPKQGSSKKGGQKGKGGK